ncbi:hypothetical protein ABOM_002740 [Aspergillus bombycis]|uniref:Uncharacterized protein n=1 Tax=Aspergillus bombycis TaxID=109264 RepID=A0A1F8A8H2_9EURO|nr:hypothetical protein ABOM_002740 [Aspergillus bombycis]OGM47973.1 hypothetical protein ABOM_002740 [Aspergillus bombycis]
MAPNGLCSNVIVQDRLPDLLIGIKHTTSHALHPITFTGVLRHWPKFEQDVETTYLNFRWNRRVVDHQQKSGKVSMWNIRLEQTAVGDEMGVQGRWSQNINQIMSAVFLSQDIDLHLGDFRATTRNYTKTPDVAAASRSTGELRLVGELKAPGSRSMIYCTPCATRKA